MANIVDYVRSATKPFYEEPLNRVDSLVLSWLAYARIPENVEDACGEQGATLAKIGGGSIASLLGLTAPLFDQKQSEALVVACAQSPRFADVVACRATEVFSREGEVQFCGITFLLPAAYDSSRTYSGAYVAFRGTDDTMVGWKENFNMTFQTMPSQTEARDYLNRVAQAVDGPLWVGGHSKGGNLAVYATSTCSASVRERIVRCFSHDGPGFTDEVRNAVPWTDADDIVDRTIPEESIIGLLFENHTQGVTVVKSTSPGILQHAPFSWVVDGDDFATAGAVSYDAYRKNKRLNAWLETMDASERERFVEVLYKLATATGEVTLGAAIDTWKDGSLEMALRRLDGLPEEDSAFFMEKIEDLAATILLGPAPSNPQTPTERANDAQDKVDDLTAHFDDRLSKIDKYLGL